MKFFVQSLPRVGRRIANPLLINKCAYLGQAVSCTSIRVWHSTTYCLFFRFPFLYWSIVPRSHCVPSIVTQTLSVRWFCIPKLNHYYRCLLYKIKVFVLRSSNIIDYGLKLAILLYLNFWGLQEELIDTISQNGIWIWKLKAPMVLYF